VLISVILERSLFARTHVVLFIFSKDPSRIALETQPPLQTPKNLQFSLHCFCLSILILSRFLYAAVLKACEKFSNNEIFPKIKSDVYGLPHGYISPFGFIVNTRTAILNTIQPIRNFK